MNVRAPNRPGVRLGGPIADTLVNLLSGLGTAKDKTTSTQFTMAVLDRAQLLFAYRGDWIARKIIDVPAQDSTREWRSWQADKKDITSIEKVEKDLRIQSKVKQAIQRSRLWGGAALVMGVDQGTPDQELRVDRVRAGQLKWVHVVNKDDIAIGRMNFDVTSEFYGEPEYYTVNSSEVGMVQVHPSRVIRFIGNEVPDINVSVNGWGDSVLQTIYDAVIHAGQTIASVAALVNESKVDVVQVPNLMEQMGTAEYRAKLVQRFTLANSMKSLTNTLILDKEEQWNRMNTTFGGLHDVINTYLAIASGAADIPATRFLGQSAKGLHATGQEDTRNYYDRLSSDQRNDLGPRLDRLDEVMLRSTFGDKPPEVTYEWNSLWQLSETEAADVAFKKSQAFTADVTANLIPPEVLREGRENQLIEDGVYPGLEVAIDEYGQQNLDEYNQAVVSQMSARAALQAPDNPDDPAAAAKAKGKALASELQRRQALPPPRPPAARSQDALVEDDTTPRSLYVRRDVINGEEILAHFADQGVDVSSVDPADLHVTVLYSRQPVDWIKMGEAYNYGPPGADDLPDGVDMCVRAGGPRVMEAYGLPPDTLVMCFASSQLCWRHCDMIGRGASSDYDDYNPHVSIAPWSGVDPKTIEPWQGEIELGPEVFEPCKAGGAAVDYDPAEPRAPAGASGGGRWTAATESAARQRAAVSARLQRTTEAVTAKTKRVAAATAHRTAAYLRDKENQIEGAGLIADQLAGFVLGTDKAVNSMVRQMTADFASHFGSDLQVARGALRAALHKAIELRRGLTGDAPKKRDDVLALLSKLASQASLMDAEDDVVSDWRLHVADYSPDQPREPAGSGRGGQFATTVGSALSAHVNAAGMNAKLLKARRLDSGRSWNAVWKTQGFNKAGNPMTVEVAREYQVLGKWRKNPDQGGDYAAGVGWLLQQQFPSLAKFADQFWHDASQNMTPREYEYAKSYFATRGGTFAEGYRAAFSPNGRAFGLSRERTNEVFARSTGQLRDGVGRAISTASGSGSPGVFSRMGEKLARMIGA